MLIRSALVEDAANASERLGALFADIDVDEDNDVWITFDEDLWPETKDPIQALAVAELLGIELEQSMVWRKLPFAWPGLGEHTFRTRIHQDDAGRLRWAKHRSKQQVTS